MKMKKADYAYLKQKLAVFAADIPAMRRAITREDKAKDIEKRLRWDLAYRARVSLFICNDLYTYLDDTHIDTALKNIVAEISPAN